jgi:sulfite exporter TauE/SafE
MHSNHSGGAMGMFLTGTPAYTTMLMWCWSANAFIRYIRKQVLSLSHGIAAKILTFEQFSIIPDFVHTFADRELQMRNRNILATTSNFNGARANMHRGLHHLSQ